MAWDGGSSDSAWSSECGFAQLKTQAFTPARRFGFEGFSPFTRPSVVTVAEGIPFATLSEMSVDRLYSLKGEIVRRGIKAHFGVDMPVFEKRRFQHGALPKETLRQRLPAQEAVYRRRFLSLYA